MELIDLKEIWPVEIDGGQIGQVIQNLVINAQQAMYEGGTVHIRGEIIFLSARQGKDFSVKEGNYIKVSVKDSGIGIPPKDLQKIFDPFYINKPKGSGLGLSTSTSIVQKNQGRMKFESDPGRGSPFSFFLLAAPSAEPAAGRSQDNRIEFGKGRILIMDDEDLFATSAKSFSSISATSWRLPGMSEK